MGPLARFVNGGVRANITGVIRSRWNLRLSLLIGVFLLALIPRALVLCDLRSDLPTFSAPEGGDSIFYDRVASGEPGNGSTRKDCD